MRNLLIWLTYVTRAIKNHLQALLGHLDRKLGHLERQQHQLMDASLGVKVMLIICFFDLFANVTMFKASLTLQSEAQTVLTKRLIKKIGDFSCNNPGVKKIMQCYLL